MGAILSTIIPSSISTSSPKKRARSDATEERATKRVCRVDTSNLLLDKADESNIVIIKKALHGMEQRSNTRRAEAQRGPFRFMGLPFEVRELVYDFVFINEKRAQYKLALCQPPNITQVYPEALRRFYTTKHFELNIQSNFNYNRSEVAIRRSGVLNMKKSVKDAVKLAGDSALYRHVTMYIKDASYPVSRQNPNGLAARCIFELRVVKGAMVCNVKPGWFQH